MNPPGPDYSDYQTLIGMTAPNISNRNFAPQLVNMSVGDVLWVIINNEPWSITKQSSTDYEWAAFKCSLGLFPWYNVQLDEDTWTVTSVLSMHESSTRDPNDMKEDIPGSDSMNWTWNENGASEFRGLDWIFEI